MSYVTYDEMCEWRDPIGRLYVLVAPGVVAHKEDVTRRRRYPPRYPPRALDTYAITDYPDALFPNGPGTLIIEEEPC